MEEYQKLQDYINQITPPDRAAFNAARKRWDTIAKPLGSLGLLEDAVAQIAAIRRTEMPEIENKVLVVFCADNGVVKQGVTQTGSEVTAQVAENLLTEDRAVASILCRRAGARVIPVDVGMCADTPVRRIKESNGTADMAEGPAMTRKACIRTLLTGIRIAGELKEKGVDLLASGEMGIGNTTTGSAVSAVLLGEDPGHITGRGAGLDSERLANKIRVIRKAIEINRPDCGDPIDVLSKVGGYDICGMAGLFLGGAVFRIPVLIDGFISSVAALAAVRICPAVSDYMIAAHLSEEPGAVEILSEIGKKALISADMHQGEGSGAVMAFPLLDMAMDIYRNMPTFAENDIEAYVPLG